MSGQHRATPEQWASQEQWASPPDSDPYALCLLELRARIEALEATQHAHADLSHLSDAEREQFYAEMAKPAAWRPLEVETTYGSEHAADAAQILNPRMVVEAAQQIRVFSAEEVAPIVVTTAEARHAADAAQILNPRMVVEGTFEHGGETYRFKANPERDGQPVPVRSADSLVERVAEGIAAADDEGLTNMTWNHHARAAIREVAAWLRDAGDDFPDGVALMLEREANR